MRVFDKFISHLWAAYTIIFARGAEMVERDDFNLFYVQNVGAVPPNIRFGKIYSFLGNRLNSNRQNTLAQLVQSMSPIAVMVCPWISNRAICYYRISTRSFSNEYVEYIVGRNHSWACSRDAPLAGLMSEICT